MKNYTVIITIKRTFKVKAEAGSEVMGKVYQMMDKANQMLMPFNLTDVKPVGDITMTLELEDEMP